MLGAINKIIEYSAVDGPGNRFVIFFQGCNYSCTYCHNPETINICNNCGFCVKSCSSNALSIAGNKVLWDEERCSNCEKCIQVCPNCSSPKVKYLSVSQIIQQIEKVQQFISGITISGGECTQQFDFLKELLIECKHRNISAFIDTNANLEFEKMKELSSYFDKAMPDIKAIDKEQHIQLTGKSIDLALKNIEFLLQENKVHEIRTVIYPQLNNEETVKKVSELISKYNKKVRYKLIKYRAQGTKKPLTQQSPMDNTMLYLKNIAEGQGCSDVIIT